MKQWMKKSLAACLALVMCLTLAACGGKEGETPAEESVNVRVAALKGPTAMGMVKLMSDYAPVEEALAAETPMSSPWPPPPTRCPPS